MIVAGVGILLIFFWCREKLKLKRLIYLRFILISMGQVLVCDVWNQLGHRCVTSVHTSTSPWCVWSWSHSLTPSHSLNGSVTLSPHRLWGCFFFHFVSELLSAESRSVQLHSRLLWLGAGWKQTPSTNRKMNSLTGTKLPVLIYSVLINRAFYHANPNVTLQKGRDIWSALGNLLQAKSLWC